MVVLGRSRFLMDKVPLQTINSGQGKSAETLEPEPETRNQVVQAPPLVHLQVAQDLLPLGDPTLKSCET